MRIEQIHPMVAHFPIALIFTAFLLYVLHLFKGSDFLKGAFKLLMFLGTAAVVAAVGAGHIAEEHAAHSDAAHAILEKYHAPLGHSVLAFMVVLTIWGILVKWNFKGMTAYLYTFFFAVAVVAIALTGYYGGILVYEHGMGVNHPGILMRMEHEHHGEEGHEHGEGHEIEHETGHSEEIQKGGHDEGDEVEEIEEGGHDDHSGHEHED